MKFGSYRNLIKIIGRYLSVKSKIKITGVVTLKCTAFIITIATSTKYRIGTGRNSIVNQETLTIGINLIVNVNWIKNMSNKQRSLSFVSGSLFYRLDRVSAKRQNRCKSRKFVARRQAFLAQFYMVIIENDICKNSRLLRRLKTRSCSFLLLDFYLRGHPIRWFRYSKNHNLNLPCLFEQSSMIEPNIDCPIVTRRVSDEKFHWLLELS